MTDLRTAAQQALEALDALQGGCTDSDDGTVEAITVWCPEVIDALRAALAEPVQEPAESALYNVTVIDDAHPNGIPWEQWVRPKNPPQRKPLTQEEIVKAVREADLDWQAGWTLDERAPNRFATLVRAVEQAHGIKERR